MAIQTPEISCTTNKLSVKIVNTTMHAAATAHEQHRSCCGVKRIARATAKNRPAVNVPQKIDAV